MVVLCRGRGGLRSAQGGWIGDGVQLTLVSGLEWALGEWGLAGDVDARELVVFWSDRLSLVYS